MTQISSRIAVGVLFLGAAVAMVGCGGSSASDAQADVGPRQPSDARAEDAKSDDAGLEDATEADASVACGGQICEAGTRCDAQAQRCVVVAEPACKTGDARGGWAPGSPAFRDASADWGLTSAAAQGQRISVADIDGDGWADLSVRAAGTTPATGGDDFSPGGARRSWLLLNRPGQPAGRVFVDATQASGLVATREPVEGAAGRPIDLVIWGDVDNDGDLDAFTAFDKGGSIGGDTAEIMLNNGDGTFAFGALDSAPRNAARADSPGGASFVDYNRDGHLDLWVTQYAANGARLQDQLFEGDGTGRFVEVTAQAGLKTKGWNLISEINAAQAHSAAWGAAACDLNGDGDPELLAASYGRAPNHLWHSQRAEDGSVSFYNASIASGYAFDARTDWTDNESARCYCKLNPGAEDCENVPEPEFIACASAADAFRWDHGYDRQPFRLGGNSGTTVCADLNNDGWLDLLTTEIVHWDVGQSSDPSEILYNLQQQTPRFERPGNQVTGLLREHDRVDWNDGDITAAVFDFDNDGRQDVYIGSTAYPGTRGLLWHQQPDGSFQAVSLADGIDHKSSHGVGVADFNRDGALDLVVGHSRSRCASGQHCYAPEDAHARIFENLAGQNNNWLQIALVGGQGSNRAAIGAQVRVQTAELQQVSEVGGGHGHYGIQHDLVQHFGLGAACEALVTVRWPDAALSEQTFVLPAGHRYTLTQGEVPRVVQP